MMFMAIYNPISEWKMDCNMKDDRKVTSIYFYVIFKHWLDIDVKMFSDWNSELNCYCKLFNTVDVDGLCSVLFQ